jgi:hypothetical protein
MSEKTGNTEKLKYDFNTATNLEIFMVDLDGWYRVTSREFRSYNGKRRINGEPYIGPVYLYNTNKKINKTKTEKNKLAGYSWISKRRPGEDLV